MGQYLRRLLASSAAYQASSLLASGLALITLPLYTRYLDPDELGYAETLLVAIILVSIVVRLGLGETLVRFWFDDEDPERRRALARRVTGWTATASTVLTLGLLTVAGPLSELLLDTRDGPLMAAGLLGLWAFTNLEIAYALLRVEERRSEYLTASCTNVVLTVTLTVTLVVGLDAGARGYVLGNYAASAVVLLALWWRLRTHVALLPPPPAALRPLIAFGGPTIPADATVFALNVVDRAWLLRADSPRAAGLYAVAAKLSAVVIVAVRGFNLAWPPLAYSVADDAQAARLYARVTTAYVAVTGTVVVAVTLLGRFVIDILDPAYEDAFAALPWVALGWALYGLFGVLVTIAGRAKVTTRTFPAAVAGLVVNVVGLVLLVEPLGIEGAGLALCGAYAVMLVVMHLLVRRLFPVPFEWLRLGGAALGLAAVAVSGELLLDPDAFLGRCAWMLFVVVALLASGALRPRDLRSVFQLIQPR